MRERIRRGLAGGFGELEPSGSGGHGDGGAGTGVGDLGGCVGATTAHGGDFGEKNGDWGENAFSHPRSSL